MFKRHNTRKVTAGGIEIGGGSPVSVQSMTNTDTRDISATISQIRLLKEAGCEIVRLAVVDTQAAEAIKEIRKAVDIPLVADIHFDYRLALECIKNGIDKIRINPGNIGGKDRVRLVAQAAKARNIPIRIGINAGSLEKKLLDKYGHPCAEAMVESAIMHAGLLEDENFNDIVISLKSSSVIMTIEAYRIMADNYDYPLHIGVTESGTIMSGTIKSCVGIGALLSEGIGDTLRVSLTSDPVDEVITANKILSALELRKDGIDFISCPTCGRCQVNLIEVAGEVERKLLSVHKSIKVAVMGCAVNGPGEAKEADYGIAGGKDEYLFFRKGEIIRKIPAKTAVDEFVSEILASIQENEI